MNEDVKIKFIDALLSGEYNQIRGALRSKDGNCANGVLCELAIQERLIGIRHGNGKMVYGSTLFTEKENSGYVSYDGILDERFRNDYPPDVVLRWAGVTRDWSARLANLNDARKTFADIAEILKNEGI